MAGKGKRKGEGEGPEEGLRTGEREGPRERGWARKRGTGVKLKKVALFI